MDNLSAAESLTGTVKDKRTGTCPSDLHQRSIQDTGTSQVKQYENFVLERIFGSVAGSLFKQYKKGPQGYVGHVTRSAVLTIPVT